MSTNITQFPLIDEYVRVNAVFEEHEAFNIKLFPMKHFRIREKLLTKIINSVTRKTERMLKRDLDQSYRFDYTAHVRALGRLNHLINIELAKYHEAGNVMIYDGHETFSAGDVMEHFQHNYILESNDGYLVFNGSLPGMPTTGSYH